MDSAICTTVIRGKGNWVPNEGTEMAFSAAPLSFPGNGLVVDPARGPTSWSTRDRDKNASITSFGCLQTIGGSPQARTITHRAVITSGSLGMAPDVSQVEECEGVRLVASE